MRRNETKRIEIESNACLLVEISFQFNIVDMFQWWKGPGHLCIIYMNVRYTRYSVWRTLKHSLTTWRTNLVKVKNDQHEVFDIIFNIWRIKLQCIFKQYFLLSYRCLIHRIRFHNFSVFYSRIWNVPLSIFFLFHTVIPIPDPSISLLLLFLILINSSLKTPCKSLFVYVFLVSWMENNWLLWHLDSFK